MILVVHERPVPVAAKSKIDISLREFPAGYWKYLLVIAIFEIGNSSNSFLILQTKSIGASFAFTILIYAGFNLVAALFHIQRVLFPIDGAEETSCWRRSLSFLSRILALLVPEAW